MTLRRLVMMISSSFIKKYSWVAVLALVLTLLVIGLLKDDEPLEVKRNGYWAEEPVLILCPSAPFTLEELQMVADKWESRGHHFEDVLDFSSCSDYQIPGFITIKTAGREIGNNHAGHARTSYDIETGIISGSSIEIFKDDLLVLEHEIGHALGYDHTNRRGHIMHPQTDGLGPDDEGLYIDEIALQ